MIARTGRADKRSKAAGKPQDHGTRGDGLADSLTTEIASGLLKPGSRLDEVRLATRFGVSRTPVREALRQLESTGLIERRPFRGAIVSAPEAAKLDDMFLAAAEIEADCARLSAMAMKTAERAALRRACVKMATLAGRDDAAGFLDADAKLHDRIYDGAHNTILAGFARDLRRRLLAYRRGQFDDVARRRRAQDEHEAIVARIEHGEGEEAAALMRSHMRRIDPPVSVSSLD